MDILNRIKVFVEILIFYGSVQLTLVNYKSFLKLFLLLITTNRLNK